LRARQITHGNNPIREVRVEPFNYTEFLRHSGEPWMDSQIAARQILKIGTVKPKAATYLVDFKFPDDGIADYAISIDASNGEYIELASFRRLADGTNVAAYRFFRILGREDKQINIVEMPERFHADDGFPRDESGKLEWLDYPEKWKPLNLHVVPAEN
jgi:hypothetical protein